MVSLNTTLDFTNGQLTSPVEEKFTNETKKTFTGEQIPTTVEEKSTNETNKTFTGEQFSTIVEEKSKNKTKEPEPSNTANKPAQVDTVQKPFKRNLEKEGSSSKINNIKTFLLSFGKTIVRFNPFLWYHPRPLPKIIPNKMSSTQPPSDSCN